MSPFIDRIVRAAKLDPYLYEEVEADKKALGEAVGVVVLSSLAAGIGTLPRWDVSDILFEVIFALITWCIWAYIVYLIGTKLLPEPQTKSDPGELLRTIGFSSSPGLIRVLGIIPSIAPVVSLIAQAWMLIAMIIAVRQALDFTGTVRATVVCIIGKLLQLIITVALFLIIGGFLRLF
jgi:hypothetical protein